MKRLILAKAVIAAACILLPCLYSEAQENISGKWNGKLELSSRNSLRIVVDIAADGKTVTLDSPDQGARGIKGFVKYLSADSVRFTVPKIAASFAGGLRAGQINGIFKQGSIELPLELVPGEGKRNRPQTPQAPFPYIIKEVTFANPAADAVLAGTLTLPEGFGADTPVVLMVTGSGLQNRDEELFEHRPFAVIADYLARRGIASLRYDDRGVGQSTGDPTEAKTTDFAQDAAAGVEYLRNKEGFAKTGVLGHSEGSTVAFILGAGRNEASRPDFIVAMGAPAVRGDSILADQSATAMRESGADETEIADYCRALLEFYDIVRREGVDKADSKIDGLFAGMPDGTVYGQMKMNLHAIARSMNPWLTQFVAFSPAEVIKSAKVPALVLYGSLDQQVRPEINMPRMQALAPGATVKLYEGLNHPFQHAVRGDIAEYAEIEETISPEVLSDIADFILKVCGD